MWIAGTRSRSIDHVYQLFLTLTFQNFLGMQMEQVFISANKVNSPDPTNKISPSLVNEENNGKQFASEHCRAEVQEEHACPSPLQPPADPPKTFTEESKEAEEETSDDVSSPGVLLRKGVEDLYDRMEKSGVKVIERIEGVMDKVAHSKEHMMKKLDKVMDKVSESMSDSKTKMIQGFDSMMDKVSESVSDSKTKVIQGLDSMMDKVSESVSDSKTKVIQGFDSVMDKMSESKDTMMKGIDDVLDKVAHSKMMEEIDNVIDKVAHSKVIEEIRALPEEIRQSFVLSTRNHSYIAAGVMVAITTAVLIMGALYFSWCHKEESWAYYLQPLHGDEKLMCTQHSRDTNPVVGYEKVQGECAKCSEMSQNGIVNSIDKKNSSEVDCDAPSSCFGHSREECDGVDQHVTHSSCLDSFLHSGKNCSDHDSLNQVRYREIKSKSSKDIGIHNHQSVEKEAGDGNR